jgi:hypothetical protein
MRVIFRAAFAHPLGSWSAGDVADLPNAFGDALLSAGVVIRVETAVTVEPTETAVADAPETAAAPTRRRGALRGA